MLCSLQRINGRWGMHREPRPVRPDLHRRLACRGHTLEAARRRWCPRRRRAREGSLRSHAPYSGRSATRGRRAVRVRPLLDRGSLAEPRLSPSRGATLARPRALEERRQDGHVLPHGSGSLAPLRSAGRRGRGGERMSTQPIQLGSRPQKPAERERLVRRAKQLAWLGVGWHGVEAAIAVGAGVVAGSIALVGFGADSLIESLAGIILLWRFAAARALSESAERSAQKLIGVSFYLIAAYVGFEAVRSLLAGARPEASWIGIGLAAVTLVTMPPLAIAKARVGDKLGSSATRSEGQQNMLCAYLSTALLVGLGANALFGLWWADPVTALLIAGVAVKEGRESWRGESCCTAPVVTGENCEDDCCRYI